MDFIRRIALAALALSISSASAQASVITLNYDFSTSNFFAAGAPVDPVTGSFSVTFDNSTTPVGTQRHAYADLVGALGDGVGEHSVDT